MQGINNLQAQYQNVYGPDNYIPPVAVIYWSFRIMVGAGFAMGALGLYALFMAMGDMFENRPKVLRLFLWAMVLPYLANTFGWLMTETGRSPWTVFGLIKLEESVSTTVTGTSVLISLIGFTLIYGAGVCLLFLHVSHGFWSLLQTFGISHPKYDYPLRVITWALAGIMGGVFLLITFLMVRDDREFSANTMLPVISPHKLYPY